MMKMKKNRLGQALVEHVIMVSALAVVATTAIAPVLQSAMQGHILRARTDMASEIGMDEEYEPYYMKSSSTRSMDECDAVYWQTADFIEGVDPMSSPCTGMRWKNQRVAEYDRSTSVEDRSVSSEAPAR